MMPVGRFAKLTLDYGDGTVVEADKVRVEEFRSEPHYNDLSHTGLLRPSTAPNKYTATIELVEGEPGQPVWVQKTRENRMYKVMRTARTEIAASTVEEVNRAKKALGVPDDATFSLGEFRAAANSIVFTWEEEVQG
jgi:hypothetical protein